MKKLNFKIVILVAAVSVVLFSSCRRFKCLKGKGDIRTENRKMQGFTKIDISGGYKVILKQDSSESIVISIDDNLM
jgi:hypothetical protein